MSGEVCKYFVEYDGGTSAECDTYQEALQFARNTDGAVVEYTYEFAGSETLDDFRPSADPERSDDEIEADNLELPPDWSKIDGGAP
jgi:hypothetical protein